MSVPFTTESPPVEFQGNPRPHSSQDESSTQTETPSTSGKSSTISPAMKAHMFYPERREGRGPKKIRNIVYRELLPTLMGDIAYLVAFKIKKTLLPIVIHCIYRGTTI